MIVTYCKKCDRYFYMSKRGSYCRACKAPSVQVPIEPEVFLKLPLSSRRRLAYRLTNEYDEVVREITEQTEETRHDKN